MHIVYLCSEYPPVPHGGIGSFVQTLARSLVKIGHRVSVVGFYAQVSDSTEDDQGVRVYRLAWRNHPLISVPENNLRLQRILQAIHADTPIDIVEGQENAFAFFPKKTSWKKIIRMHGGHTFFATELGESFYVRKMMMEKCSFRKADSICAVSNYVSTITLKLLKLDKKVTILPNPVDTDLFQPRPGIPEEEGCIVFVGSLCEKKGIRQLIQAMPAIVEAQPLSHLLVVGRDVPDKKSGASFKQRLITEIPEEIQEKISFLGIVDHDQLPEILAKAQVCIYPSHMESMGIAWVEGLAMGKPVIASYTGPGREIIDDGINGLLCDPFSPESIAEKTIQVLANDVFRTMLGRKAREKAIQNYSIDSLVSQNVEFYELCMK